jgi:hypothetical protein
MKYTHQLTSENQDFLNQNRTDPITGEKIEEGHSVVICAACKSAFFIESWEYLGDSHCDQTGTLENLPKPQNLYLQANTKYTRELLTFGFSNSEMFVESQAGCGLSIVGGFFSIILTAIMGVNYGGQVAFFTIITLLSLCVFFGMKSIMPVSTKDKSIKQIENMKAKFSICIDYKNKGLLINSDKPKNKQKFTPFADIKEFKYHVMYHPSRDIDALFCQLQIRITTKERRLNYLVSSHKDCFATIHRDTIPEWSDFISKLPTDLRILNTPFVNEYNS